MRIPTLLVCAALAALASCEPRFEQASRMIAGPEPREPVLDRRRTYYLNDTSRPRLESQVLVFFDGSVLRHGLEREWSESGTLVAEREFARGEPAGRWRTWFPSGRPRSESAFGPEPATWSWWYESGQLSSQGPALGGVKQGRWTAWHENGVESSEGDYSAGKREGEWSFWNEEGSLLERGEFRADVKVGRWQSGS